MAQAVDRARRVYSQAPFYHFLSHGCCPTLAWIVVIEFRNSQFVQDLISDNQNHEAPTHASAGAEAGRSQSAADMQDQGQEPKSLWDKTLYDFLSVVNRKGKRLEDKQRKRERGNHARGREGRLEEETVTSSILHVSNLKDNQDALSQLSVKKLLQGNIDDLKIAADVLKTLDVTFLLNLLCNDIIKFKLKDKVHQAITSMKELRNEVSHSGLECDEERVVDYVRTLCDATLVLCEELPCPVYDLRDMKDSCLKEAEENASSLAKEVILKLKEEIHPRYSPVKHQVFPRVRYSGREYLGESSYILESLEEFVRGRCCTKPEQLDPHPLLLFGSSGVGKSSLVDKLANALTHDALGSGPLVLTPSPACCKHMPGNLWNQVSKDLERVAPRSFKMYSAKILVRALRERADEILFLADWNVHRLTDIKCGTTHGTWLITHSGAPEDPPPPHCLTVEELTPAQVEQMLLSLNPDPDQHAMVLESYRTCQYQGVLTRPDIVCVFSELRCTGNVPLCQMLECYVAARVPSTTAVRDDLNMLGKLAFEMIQSNRGKYYSQQKISQVPHEVRDPLMVQEDGGITFRYCVVEDYLAALYVVSSPKRACCMWLDQCPLFKRVFRFVSWYWCSSTDNIQAILPFMKSYLIRFLDIPATLQQEDMEVDVSENEENSNKKGSGMGGKGKKGRESVMEKESRKNSLSKWAFLMRLAEDCRFHPDVLNLLAELVSHKTTWHFKCRALNYSVVEKLSKVLSLVVPSKPIIIKLESGCNSSLITRVWELLNSLPCLHSYAAVEFTIIHAEDRPLQYRRKLMALAQSIARAGNASDGNLTVTKYVGPLVCLDTPQFLRCPSMQGLKVLDVRVCDKTTLAELFACQGLSSLCYMAIKVTLKVEEQAATSGPRLKVPWLDTAPLYLTIQYFSGIQNLLDLLDAPECLTYLSLRNIYVHQKFQLDLSKFTGLSCLFLWFESGKLEPLPSLHLPGSTLTRNSEITEESEKDEKVDEQLLYREWALKLNHGLIIPRSLQRLMLRNAGFIDDLNHFLLNHYWRKYGVWRLLVLDTNLSVSGATALLRSYIKLPTSQQLVQDLKRMRMINDTDKTDLLHKQPRLAKKERESIKKAEKGRELGQELVVTSENTSCDFCFAAPCICKEVNLEEYCKKMVAVVELIKETYNYSGHSFCFSSRVLKMRRDVCGDLRVYCVLTRLNDLTVTQPQEHRWLTVLLDIIGLAQFITFEKTQLTQRGIMALVGRIWASKESLNAPEPFSLVVSSVLHPTGHDKTSHSHLVSFLRKSANIVQFYFRCCCSKTCQHYLKKTYDGAIYLNNVMLCTPPPLQDCSR